MDDSWFCDHQNMENNLNNSTEIIENFEEILKHQSTSRIPALYSKITNQIPRKAESIKAQDILKNVSCKIHAINNADCVKSDKPVYMNKYKKSTFLPVNMLPRDDEPPQQPINKFETQCVSDTQLIDIVQDAEAMIGINKGMTQEFETSFCAGLEIEDYDIQKHLQPVVLLERLEQTKVVPVTIVTKPKSVTVQTSSDEIKPNVTQKEPGFCIVTDISVHGPKPNKTINLTQLSQNSEDNVNLIETQTEDALILNESIELEDGKNQIGIHQNFEIPSSPIFNIRSREKPLVVTLEAFEKFEEIAFPNVQKSPDLETARQLINSQLSGKELYIQSDAQFVFNGEDRFSPILNPVLGIKKREIDNMDLKANFTKESDLNSEGSDTFILKDEILFSSDEEGEYVNKSFQDLPVTCALETSFYDQSDVLDKTMYVGFQTASNKSIQIDTVSFTKAKSIFDAIDKPLSVKEPTLTELVNLCGVTDDQIILTYKVMEDDCKAPFKTTEIVTEYSNKIPSKYVENTNDQYVETTIVIEDIFKSTFNNLLSATIVEDSKDEAISNIDSFVIGFKKDNEKSIDMSKETIIKSKDIFKDIDVKGQISTEKPIEISREIIKCNSNILPNVNTAFPKEFLENTNNIFIKPTLSKRKFEGFKTASNKRIKLSDIALERTKKVFQDIALNEKEILMDIDQENNIKIPDTMSDNLNKPIKLEQKSDYVFEESLKNDKNKDESLNYLLKINVIDNPEFHNIDDVILKEFENDEIAQTQLTNEKETGHDIIRFKTINNKRIKISEAASAETKHLFQDIGNFDLEISSNVTKKNNPVSSKIGFKTASDKKIKISDKALAKTKSIFHDVDSLVFLDLNEPSASSAFVGFKTANNKFIDISEKAISKTKNIFKDIENEDYTQLNTKETTILNEIIKPINTNNLEFSQTAFNEKVDVSKKILETKKFFQDEETIHTDHEYKNKQENIPYPGFQTASSKKCLVSKPALEKTKKIFQDENIFTTEKKTSGFIGFQTASNKKVQVSKEALEKTKKIFQNEEIFNQFKNQDENIIDFQGFRTANNKKVEVTKHFLEKTKPIFQDEEVFITDNKTTDFIVFQTASNKKVQVSKEALETTKKILEDEKICLDNKPQFKGFQTVSDEKVSIVSNETLTKTKKIFQDEELFNTDNKTFGFVGFQTASNKKVLVSKEALEKTKKIFEDEKIFLDNKSQFKGFQTVSDKKVSILEDAVITNSKVYFTDEKVNFKGFQTANNKDVKVPKQALAKSKLFFQDIDYNNTKQNELTDYNNTKTIRSREQNLPGKRDANVFGFKTANNNNINISEKGFEKSKHVFAELDKVNTEKSKTDLNSAVTKDHCKVDTIINTQVLNNFEVTLNTEDFMKENKSTPNTSEGSRSPILSCPKPKTKKKFKIPYSQCKVKNLKDVIKNVEKELENTENILKFDAAYKKNKAYCLKDLERLEKAHEILPKNIDPYILNFDYENLLSFEFTDERNDVNNSTWTTEDLKKHFLNSVSKKLVPDGWIQNHLKLILWKLISYEIRFPNTMKGTCAVQNVIDQLKYRYDKELYNAVRPALRKIFEKDDVSTRTIVLCVVAIYGDGVTVDNTTNTTELLLTDGWYCIKAITDKMLTKIIRDQKIVVGMKIATNGAELLNCEQGVSPWEDTTAIRLKLSGNSTRRARWDARLGCHGNAAILCPLSSVTPEGGRVSKLRAFVCRVYPTLYIDKFEDGSTVTRSERLEHLHQMKYEAERQMQLEKLYEEVEKEFCDQSNLSQTISLPNSNSKREKLLKDIQTRVQQKMEERDLNVPRNVVALTKVRVAGVDDTSLKITRAMLSIWKPNDAILEMMKEGVWIELMNVVPTAVRYSELHISAGRQSVFRISKYKEPDRMKPYTKSLKRTCHAIRDLARNPSMTTEYNEIDTVGLTFLIDPSIIEFDSAKHQFQNIYLADADKNMICINFWGGLKKFGFENIFDTGQIVSCVNLQKRAGNTRKNIPQYRVTEFSYFTKTPKSEDAWKIMEDLSKKIYGVDRKRFCEDCAVLRTNYCAVKLQSNNENVFPYRFQNVDMNSSRNKVFIDSPLARKTSKNDDILNLTGLDFESTFKQAETQELSPKTLMRKRQVKEKIAKLKMYGEPPPLSPINITNRSKIADKAFKSPLISKYDISTSVASKKKILPNEQKIVNEGMQRSPLSNRKYVNRTVKPVKLNFTNSVAMGENNVSDIVDHFAGDFESSPPLSLD